MIKKIKDILNFKPLNINLILQPIESKEINQKRKIQAEILKDFWKDFLKNYKFEIIYFITIWVIVITIGILV